MHSPSCTATNIYFSGHALHFQDLRRGRLSAATYLYLSPLSFTCTHLHNPARTPVYVSHSHSICLLCKLQTVSSNPNATPRYSHPMRTYMNSAPHMLTWLASAGLSPMTPQPCPSIVHDLLSPLHRHAAATFAAQRRPRLPTRPPPHTRCHSPCSCLR